MAGSVPYVFEIAKDELTVAQYVEFLNAVAADDPYELLSRLDRPRQCGVQADVYCIPPRVVRTGVPGSYSYEAAPDLADHPVGIHPFAIMRFMNWLHHGQPSGPAGPDTTESGAYDCVNVATPGDCTFPHVPGARFRIATLDEMHKAAFWNKQAQTWHWWPTVPGVTQANAPLSCSPGLNPCPDPPTGNEVNTSGARMCHIAGSRGCEFLPVASYPATTSPFGVRDLCGGVGEPVEHEGETNGVSDFTKIMGHTISWWGAAIGDCQADTISQTILRNSQGELAGVSQGVRPVRMVPYPGGLVGEILSSLVALALARRASRARRSPAAGECHHSRSLPEVLCGRRPTVEE
jgi:hypothetical protein